jgi:hypothetical protein
MGCCGLLGMRMLKGSGRYLWVQAWKNLVKAGFCIVITAVLFPFVLLYPLEPPWLKLVLLGASLVPLVGASYYSRRYGILKAGQKGEKQTINLLKKSLNDNYCLINGVRVRGLGDVDHVVVGPNGVFVLETKNWSGKISCNGDLWQRNGKTIQASPSHQAKNNAVAIRKLINQKRLAGELWVEAGVVFTNRHAKLQVNRPPCTILQLPQLTQYLTNHKGTAKLSRLQVEEITNQILKQT